MSHRTPPPRLGALERWREEFRRGTRGNDSKSFDWLAAAACHEIHALELIREGKFKEAAYWMDAGLLKLHQCPGMPDDKDRNGNPGPGARLLAQLKAQAAQAGQRAGAA